MLNEQNYLRLVLPNLYTLKTKTLLILLYIAILESFALSLKGQELPPQVQQDSLEIVADTIQEIALEPTQITEAFQESNSLLIEAGKLHYSKETITRYIEEVDTLFATILHFIADSAEISINGVSLRELDLITQQADYYNEELKNLQERLTNESNKLDGTARLLDANKDDWQLILADEGAESIPEDRLERINRTIHHLDSLKLLLMADLSMILIQEDRLSDKMNDIEQLLVWVEDQRILIGERFFTRELPGFFESWSNPADTAMVQKHLAQIKKSLSSDIDIVKTKYRKQMGVILILLVLFIVFALWFRKNYHHLISEKFVLSDIQKTLIHSPVVTALFLIGLLIRFALPHLPHSIRSANLIVMTIPMIIIFICIIGPGIRNWIILLSVLAGLTFFYEFTYNPDILLRTITLAFSLSAIALFLWLLIKRPFSNQRGQKIIYRILRTMFKIFIILLSIAVIANLVGAFSLAEFFTLVSIQIGLLAFGIELATTIADALIYLLLASKSMQKVNMVRDDFDYIYKKTVVLVDLLLWGLFFVIALYIFRIKDLLFEWVEGLFTNGIKVGAVEITIGSILIFILVIWVSIVITRIIRHVLEKEVFPRVNTPKGVPSTVVLFLRIILISSGFLLAAAAAGIKLTNLSIVLGAFSVGIGFGLQNIFNNMVSGLILALERPIKVGDVVQVGDLIGTVRSIGLRSSNVKSFYGAEVIVPNGNLISNEMINWTLSDSNRRMDLRIGVAYGSDTDLVIDILQQIAISHPHVDKIPSPKAYFIGFGDSALDFRLLAWTHIDQRLEVESDLNGNINKALLKAGIEIPFPQRDLHIRSGNIETSNN